VRRFSLLPAWLLSLAAWGAPPGLPDVDAIQQEMARQKARSQELLRRAEDTFRADPGRPVQSAPRIPNPVDIPSAGADPLAIAERYRKTLGTPCVTATPGRTCWCSCRSPCLRPASNDWRRTRPRRMRCWSSGVPRMDRSSKPCRPLNPWPSSAPAPSSIRKPSPGTGSIQCRCFVLGTAAGGGCDDAADSCRETLRIAGDASLEYILERMARASHPLAEEAERRLTRLRGTP
jgi:hypothetical protein